MRNAALILVLAAVAVPALVLGHCQVPCGIYDDELRFQTIEEHITTVEKAMTSLAELSPQGAQNLNQIVRWVETKESHAQEIQDIMSAYFFTQRLKPVGASDAGYADYLESLRLIHEVAVSAMMCKQTVDPANVAGLRKAVAAYNVHYFKDKEHDHE